MNAKPANSAASSDQPVAQATLVGTTAAQQAKLIRSAADFLLIVMPHTTVRQLLSPSPLLPDAETVIPNNVRPEWYAVLVAEALSEGALHRLVILLDKSILHIRISQTDDRLAETQVIPADTNHLAGLVITRAGKILRANCFTRLGTIATYLSTPRKLQEEI